MRRTDGSDGGGYRYSAFGQEYAHDTQAPTPAIDQPLRWKARQWSDFAQLYDVRARWWSPQLGVFTSVDELSLLDKGSSLWGWARQSPIRFSDPSGRDATTDNAVQQLRRAGWLPRSFTQFGNMAIARNSAIVAIANPSTAEQGLNALSCIQETAQNIATKAEVKFFAENAAAIIAGGAAGPLLRGAGGLVGEGTLLFHGSDLASVDNIVANGLDQEAAAALGGGDVFWTTTDIGTARWFAEANPAMSDAFGIVGMRVDIAAAERAGIIAFDTPTGAYVVTNWDAFNNIAQFFRAE